MDLQVQPSGTLAVSDTVFGAEFNEALVHQVVTAYMAGGRAGTKAQKGRSDVNGGGRKPWRQKGTGRARAGTIRSPIWRGGGKVFAASPRDYSQKVNRKMYRAAMRSILSELQRQERVIVVEAIDVDEPKTKALLAHLDGLGMHKGLIVGTEVSDKLYLAARNVHGLEVLDVEAVNPLSLVAADKVLVTADAMKKIEEWLA